MGDEQRMSRHSSDESDSSESSSMLTEEEETESGEEEEEEGQRETQPQGRAAVEYTLKKGSSSKPDKSQKALLAEAAHTQEPPSWLKKALKPRAAVALQVEEKRRSQMVQSAEKQEMPEWIEKSKRMSRDVRGLERYFKMKPPDLPPEPEWIGKAAKRRDLSVLVQRNNLQTHLANKEAPDWVKEGAFSKKILSAFLQSDAELSPDWMEESRAMSPEEKKHLLDKIEELRKVLAEEERITEERKKILAEANEAVVSGGEALGKCRSTLAALDEAGESPEAAGLADATEGAFTDAAAVFEGIRETYGIVVPEQIRQLVEEANHGGEKEDKKKKKKKKKSKRAEGEAKKSSKKKAKRDPNETSEEKRVRRAARAERKEQRRLAREQKAKEAAGDSKEAAAGSNEADAVVHTKKSDPKMLESSRDSPLLKKKKKQEKKKKAK